MTKLFIDDTGWLKSVEVIHSPNYDARPDNTKIKLIVVHGISLPPGEYGGDYIQKYFCNNLDSSVHDYFPTICDMKVSAHCLIERNGNIIQFVSFLDRAWHAGASEWQGEPACNDFSIGIELEGTDHEAYDHRQYQSLATLVNTLRSSYPDIGGDAVAGHCDIAPNRKSDPGPAFDWPKLQQLVNR
jgi:AmpD protein